MIANLSQKVKELPRSPGVYIFKNSKGIPLYVGKAARLRDRVRTYFQGTLPLGGPLHERMQREIADVEVRQTQSEIEALVLESTLIKTLKPRYNISMRDDKQYFYVGFTKEPFPKLVITHQRKVKNKKLLTSRASVLERRSVKSYCGPFVSGRSLHITLRLLRKIFPYCSCKRLHASEKSCLNYAMGIDPGYCCAKSNNQRLTEKVKDYKNNIAHIKSILRGKKTKVLKELLREMDKAAKNQNFERAAKIRDQIERIQHVLAHKGVIAEKGEISIASIKDSLLKDIRRIEGYDISNVQGQFAVGSMVVIQRNDHGVFAPKKSDYRRFKVKTITGANDPAMMHEVLMRRLNHREWPFPELILVDGGKAQRNAAIRALKNFLKKEEGLAPTLMDHKFVFCAKRNAPLVWGLAKREEELYTQDKMIPLAHLNPQEARLLAFIRDEAHRFAVIYYRKIHKKDLIP